MSSGTTLHCHSSPEDTRSQGCLGERANLAHPILPPAGLCGTTTTFCTQGSKFGSIDLGTCGFWGHCLQIDHQFMKTEAGRRLFP